MARCRCSAARSATARSGSWKRTGSFASAAASATCTRRTACSRRTRIRSIARSGGAAIARGACRPCAENVGARDPAAAAFRRARIRGARQEGGPARLGGSQPAAPSHELAGRAGSRRRAGDSRSGGGRFCQITRVTRGPADNGCRDRRPRRTRRQDASDKTQHHRDWLERAVTPTITGRGLRSRGRSMARSAAAPSARTRSSIRKY